ncbi:hypothetical protein GCM10008908_34600 [Clostridium subterminale]|uniref:OmpA-like domain-containing protein n=1 Tax=Clostridium subterminale TaxID=1550 RepID=A0ABP3W9N6_CLOSU
MEINTNIVFKCRELINALYLATKKLNVMENVGFKGIHTNLNYAKTRNAQVRVFLKNYGINSLEVVLEDSYKEVIIKEDSS